MPKKKNSINLLFVKSSIQFLLQKLLGYKLYLFIFSVFSIYRFQLTQYDKEFAYFLQLAKQFKGDILLDVGANIGVTATLLGKNFTKNTVWAFEPVSSNMGTLKKVIQFFKLKNIQTLQTAVGEQAGVTQIFTPVQNGVKKQGLSYILELNSQINLQSGVEQVQMISLDGFMQNNLGKRIIAIKIDVENYELFVLKGASKLLQTDRPLVFAELWEDERKLACIQFMDKLGYTAKVLYQGNLIDYKGITALNYFFIPLEVSLNIK